MFDAKDDLAYVNVIILAPCCLPRSPEKTVLNAVKKRQWRNDTFVEFLPDTKDSIQSPWWSFIINGNMYISERLKIRTACQNRST